MPTIDLDATAADAALIGSLPEGLRTIPVDHLYPHPKNPRRDVGDVTELADSIREHGIRQPLLAVPDPGDPQRYRLVIGHRRHAGAVAAGLADVPVIVDPTLTDADQLELMLVENVQRSDLSAVEEADGYQGLLDLGMDVEAMAKRTGRSESTVRRRLALVTLPEEARTKVHAGTVTLEQVARLPEPDAVTPKQYDKLINALGSHNFHYALSEVETANRKRDEWVAMQEKLAAAGIKVVKPAPKDYVRVHGYYYSSDIPKEAKTDWVFVPTQRPYGDYFRPRTKAEAKDAAARVAERAAEDAANAAVAQRRARLSTVAEVSASTRREFLVDAITRKNPKAPAALVEFLASVTIRRYHNGWAAYQAPGTLVAETVEPLVLVRTVGPWLGCDTVDDSDLVDTAGYLAKWDAVTPAGRLLAMAAAAIEPVPVEVWAATDEDNAFDLAAWYDLLLALGYTPSDHECSALAGDLDALPGGED